MKKISCGFMLYIVEMSWSLIKTMLVITANDRAADVMLGLLKMLMVLFK